MPNGKFERVEGYPSLTAREHWGKYAAGMATEVLFVLTLTAAGLLIAAIAMVIWR
jgi:biopolymer transport protein ExbB/TolQ